MTSQNGETTKQLTSEYGSNSGVHETPRWHIEHHLEAHSDYYRSYIRCIDCDVLILEFYDGPEK